MSADFLKAWDSISWRSMALQADSLEQFFDRISIAPVRNIMGSSRPDVVLRCVRAKLRGLKPWDKYGKLRLYDITLSVWELEVIRKLERIYKPLLKKVKDTLYAHRSSYP